MHIDLFTGIAGFSLACHWAGIQTEVMCEIDERCRQFLKRTWPRIPIVPDVRDFDGTKWQGRFLLTAGVPCQPASRAGKQGGKKDDRWLWPETLRVISEARPDWCLFENPPGIDDVGLGGILADLEAQGYEVAPPLIIPACAVNSPQLRARYWIVANARHELRKSRGNNRAGAETERSAKTDKPQRSSQGDLADTETTSRLGLQDGKESESFAQDGQCNTDFWRTNVWLPCADGKIRRAPDDTFLLADGIPTELLIKLGQTHRSALAGLGNSIVPQVAYEIIRAIKEVNYDL